MSKDLEQDTFMVEVKTNSASFHRAGDYNGWLGCAWWGWQAAMASKSSDAQIRDAALEEAALFIDNCEEAGETVSFSTVSASIRALKIHPKGEQ